MCFNYLCITPDQNLCKTFQGHLRHLKFYEQKLCTKGVLWNDIQNVCKKKNVGTYSGGQNKVGQVLLRNLAKIELSKPGLL
jgi:hypothetical protein